MRRCATKCERKWRRIDESMFRDVLVGQPVSTRNVRDVNVIVYSWQAFYKSTADLNVALNDNILFDLFL